MLTVPIVEMPTLTVSTGIAQGSAKAVESISLATSGVGHRGIDISFIDFFYVGIPLPAFAGCFHLPPP
jgi:hypothetical protein